MKDIHSKRKEAELLKDYEELLKKRNEMNDMLTESIKQIVKESNEIIK